MALHDYWPLFGLRISTPRLELQMPGDTEIAQLIDVIKRGVHDPSWMPFDVPWTDSEPPELERGILQYWWRCRAGYSPTNWDLGFAIRHDGELLGCQNLGAVDFPTVRSATTGSWLGMDHQGKGFGKEMRRAVVDFAFEYLGAHEVTSAAYVDNAASAGVSLAVGYEENGRVLRPRRDGVGEQVRFRLTRERWLETRTDERIEVSGFESCREMLGL